MADQSRPNTGKNAYVTLLTRPSYLAGAILLAYTLTKHSPDTPLIITYTPETLPESSIQAFRDEAKHSNIILHDVEHLRLPDSGESNGASGMVAERFIDTWTKLRVFDLYDLGFERLCWLDADMMIFSDPSPLIFNAANDEYLQGGDGKGLRMMAVHTCVCNLDHDSWAPPAWKPENCAMAKLEGSDELAKVETEPDTLSNFNSGTFLYRPSRELAAFVQDKFEELGNEALRAMKFPDQDFLNEAFDQRWAPLSWKTNALKTWRYWHTNIWRDGEVAVLHYIVDKPWAARGGAVGRGGYLGKDGETHGWWWDEYGRWEAEREGQGESDLLEIVGKYAANKDGRENEEMRAVGGGAQDYAKRWEGKEEEVAPVSDAEAGVGLRKPVGEKGHGPVRSGFRGGKGRGEGWSIMES